MFVILLCYLSLVFINPKTRCYKFPLFYLMNTIHFISPKCNIKNHIYQIIEEH